LDVDEVHLKNIVLEIDMHSFSSLLVDDTHLLNDLWFYKKYMSYSEMKEIRNESYPALYIEANFPFIGSGSDIIANTINHPKLTEIYQGWSKSDINFSSTPNKEAVAMERANVHFKGYERINPLIFEYFLKTLSLAKENNLTVILVSYPVSKEFDEAMEKLGITKDDYYSTIFDGIDSVLDEYMYFDYYDMFFYNPELLFDPDHLNSNGAETFTKKIYEDYMAEKMSQYIESEPNHKVR